MPHNGNTDGVYSDHLDDAEHDIWRGAEKGTANVPTTHKPNQTETGLVACPSLSLREGRTKRQPQQNNPHHKTPASKNVPLSPITLETDLFVPSSRRGFASTITESPRAPICASCLRLRTKRCYTSLVSLSTREPRFDTLQHEKRERFQC